MNGALAHLLVNHLPLFAAAFAAALAAAGLALGKSDLQKAAAWGFLGAALAALAAYFTGEGAEHVVERLPGVAEAAIHAHEEAAEKALVSVLLLGAGAGAVLVRARGRSPSRLETAVLLAASLAAAGLLAWAAHLGGLIRHTELS